MIDTVDAPARAQETDPRNAGRRRWWDVPASPVPLALLGVIAAAAVLRLVHLHAGVPYAVGIDEPAIVDRALRMDRTGDLNPHFFDYPALVFYLQAVAGLARYAVGLVAGAWRSPAQMDGAALYGIGRSVAVAVALAGVYFTYRAGKELSSAWTGVLAAALLAVHPQHVRESHYILADVPGTTFVTLALWLAFRAGRVRSTAAFALAGFAAGLAAASKYNGAFVILPVVVVALFCVPPRRWPAALGAAVGTMAAVFVIINPWVILDSRAFREGISELVARFDQPRVLSEAPWVTYLKHIGRVTTGWMPAAVVGLLLGLVVGPRRRLWLALALFAGGYFYVISHHPPVFARYALPLAPVMCLAVAAAVVETARVVGRWWKSVAVRAVAAAAALWFVGSLALPSARWVHQISHTDTRHMAAVWLQASAPAGSRVAVENFGPTNLDHAGFDVLQMGRLIDRPFSWYVAEGYRYLVVSDWNLREYHDLAAGGHIELHLVPDRDRWGPETWIVRLPGAPR